ncbi:hypothetical protein OHB54_19310 [Streptomyces sp. NBC_01007]|nr:hypothetical protein OHB54_19310 [Streptomyces sp. NBC_01007]
MEPDKEPDKGERHGGGGAPDRSVVHPANPGSEPGGLETLLAAAMRGRAADTEAETQAVAAFRAARDDGAHTARTRRRDDWRTVEQRRPSRSVRAAFAVLLAGLTLGGVAFAAVGPSSHDDGGHRDGAAARPSGSVADRFSAEAAPPVGPGAPGVLAPSGSVETDPPGRPPRARDTVAHCRAYASVGGRGNALNARAWQRLVTAAGGEDKVDAYCAGQLAAHTGTEAAKGSGATGNPGKSGNAAGTPVPRASAATPRPTKSRSER